MNKPWTSVMLAAALLAAAMETATAGGCGCSQCVVDPCNAEAGCPGDCGMSPPTRQTGGCPATPSCGTGLGECPTGAQNCPGCQGCGCGFPECPGGSNCSSGNCTLMGCGCGDGCSTTVCELSCSSSPVQSCGGTSVACGCGTAQCPCPARCPSVGQQCEDHQCHCGCGGCESPTCDASACSVVPCACASSGSCDCPDHCVNECPQCGSSPTSPCGCQQNDCSCVVCASAPGDPPCQGQTPPPCTGGLWADCECRDRCNLQEGSEANCSGCCCGHQYCSCFQCLFCGGSSSRCECGCPQGWSQGCDALRCQVNGEDPCLQSGPPPPCGLCEVSRTCNGLPSPIPGVTVCAPGHVYCNAGSGCQSCSHSCPCSVGPGGWTGCFGCTFNGCGC